MVVSDDDPIIRVLNFLARRPIRPGVVGAAVWVATALGRIVWHHRWWVPLVVGLPVIALGAWLARGKMDPRFVVGGGGAALAWALVAWLWTAPWTPIMATAYLTGLGVIWIAWAWHGRTRSQVSIPGGRWFHLSYWRIRSELSSVLEDWDWNMSHVGLVGVHATGVEYRPHGYRVSVTLSGHVHMGDIDAKRDRLAVGLKANAGLGVTVQGDRTHSHKGTVMVFTSEPHYGVTPWRQPTPSISITTPLYLGRYDDWEEVMFQLIPAPGQVRHTLITGVTGSGKSNLIHVILGHLAFCEDAVVWLWDPKRGAEYGEWDKAVDRIARTPEEWATQASAAIRVMEARKEYAAVQGRMRKWTPSRDHPQLVLILDEGKAALKEKIVADAFDRLIAEGRSLGIVVIFCTQRASIESMRGGDFRSQFSAVITTHVPRVEDIKIALGQGKAKEGWRPDRAPRAGSFLLSDPDHLVAQRAMGALFDDDLIDEVAKLPAPWRAGLDQVSQEAADDPGAQNVILLPPRSQDASDTLLGTIAASGMAGVKVGELDLAALGMSRAHVYNRLNTLVASGKIEKGEESRYRAISQTPEPSESITNLKESEK